MYTEQVHDDVQHSVGIEIECTNKSHNFLPYRLDPGCNFRVTLRWPCSLAVVLRAEAACQLRQKFAVTFGLFTEQVELRLLEATEAAQCFVNNCAELLAY